jgi:PAS domain S-box-containing protein
MRVRRPPDGDPLTTATQAGAAEEAALAAIVLSSQDAVIAKTVDGIVTAWNDGATLVYGYNAADMLGQSIELTIPSDHLDEERARHARVANGVAESGYRCTRRRADGARIAVVMSMSPVRNGGGQVVGVASISRPVSDKESSDARFASLLEAAPDAMVCVDAGGRIAMVNAQVSVLFGYSRSELIGAPMEILIPAELGDLHRHHRDDFFRHPAPRAMGAGLSLQARRRDGSTFPVEVSLAADTEGGDTLAIAAVRDVTAQRATEAALRESETQLRQLAENVDTVFALRQIDPRAYLYVSPGFRRLTGWGPEDLSSDLSLPLSMVHPDDRERVESSFFEPSDPWESARSEHRIIRADGEVRWVRTSARPVPNPHGPPERIVTTTEDITERVQAAHALKEAETTARAANDAKNEFLSRMSHELRTPLNAVLGFGQLLELHLVDSEQLGFARHVVQAGRHLLDLINEVLDIARIEAGEMTVSHEPVAVADIVAETALLMQPLADTGGVALTVAPGPLGLYVLADRQRLRQILLNLISNAIKYNRAGGSVWLSWNIQDGRPSLTVRDDGPGISRDLHERLFTPFDRLGAEASAVEGTGVGLTVTRGLTELMNGELLFESDSGQGSLFTVRLPRSEEPLVTAPQRQELQSLRVEQAHGSSTVLYIEDNEPNVRVMESVLALRPEWRLVHARLASVGIERARDQRPDLILLDVHLPDGSGLDVLSALKNDKATAGIRVVVLSADASVQQVTRMLEAGAAQYLTKPLDLPELLAALDSVATAKTEAAEAND